MITSRYIITIVLVCITLNPMQKKPHCLDQPDFRNYDRCQLLTDKSQNFYVSLLPNDVIKMIMGFAQIKNYEQYKQQNYKQSVIIATNAAEHAVQRQKYFDALKLILQSNLPELCNAHQIGTLVTLNPLSVQHQSSFNPLLHAVESCEPSVVEVVCKGNCAKAGFFASLRDEGELFFKAVIQASFNNDPEKVKILHTAIHTKKVDMLSQVDKFTINVKGRHGPCAFEMAHSPLSFMAYNDKVHGAQTLLQSGCYTIDDTCQSCNCSYYDSNGYANYQKYSGFYLMPLIVALIFKQWAFAKFCVENNASLKFYDSELFDTPLVWAIRHQAPQDLIRLMLQHGASVLSKNPSRTPYKMALWHHQEVIPLLVQSGANPAKEATELVATLKSQGAKEPF